MTHLTHTRTLARKMVYLEALARRAEQRGDEKSQLQYAAARERFAEELAWYTRQRPELRR